MPLLMLSRLCDHRIYERRRVHVGEYTNGDVIGQPLATLGLTPTGTGHGTTPSTSWGYDATRTALSKQY